MAKDDHQEAPAGTRPSPGTYAAVEGLLSHWDDLSDERKLLYAQMAVVTSQFMLGDRVPKDPPAAAAAAAEADDPTSVDPAILPTREIAALLARFACNSHTICDDELRPLGVGLYDLGAMVNHSCSPNCMQSFRGPNIAFRAIRPIAVGEECTISYVELCATRRQRREQLLTQYLFDIDAHPSSPAALSSPPLSPASGCSTDVSHVRQSLVPPAVQLSAVSISSSQSEASTAQLQQQPPANASPAATSSAVHAASISSAGPPSTLCSSLPATAGKCFPSQQAPTSAALPPRSKVPCTSAPEVEQTLPLDDPCGGPSCSVVVRVYGAGETPPWPCDDKDAALTSVVSTPTNLGSSKASKKTSLGGAGRADAPVWPGGFHAFLREQEASGSDEQQYGDNEPMGAVQRMDVDEAEPGGTLPTSSSGQQHAAAASAGSQQRMGSPIRSAGPAPSTPGCPPDHSTPGRTAGSQKTWVVEIECWGPWALTASSSGPAGCSDAYRGKVSASVSMEAASVYTSRAGHALDGAGSQGNGMELRSDGNGGGRGGGGGGGSGGSGDVGGGVGGGEGAQGSTNGGAVDVGREGGLDVDKARGSSGAGVRGDSAVAAVVSETALGLSACVASALLLQQHAAGMTDVHLAIRLLQRAVTLLDPPAAPPATHQHTLLQPSSATASTAAAAPSAALHQQLQDRLSTAAAAVGLGPLHVLRADLDAALLKRLIDEGNSWPTALATAERLLAPYQLVYAPVWPNLCLHWALVCKLRMLLDDLPGAVHAARAALAGLRITHSASGVTREVELAEHQAVMELRHSG